MRSLPPAVGAPQLHVDFEGGRVRPWTRDDRDALVRHSNSQRVARFLSTRFPHPYGPADAEAWLAFLASQPEPEGWAIDVDGEAVGGIGLRRGVADFAHSAELGYWLGEAYWGRGLMTRVVRAVLPAVVARFGLIRVTAYAACANPASLRVLEKAGFAREGLMRARAIRDGEIQDHAVFGWIDDTRVAR